MVSMGHFPTMDKHKMLDADEHQKNVVALVPILLRSGADKDIFETLFSKEELEWLLANT